MHYPSLLSQDAQNSPLPPHLADFSSNMHLSVHIPFPSPSESQKKKRQPRRNLKAVSSVMSHHFRSSRLTSYANLFIMGFILQNNTSFINHKRSIIEDCHILCNFVNSTSHHHMSSLCFKIKPACGKVKIACFHWCCFSN